MSVVWYTIQVLLVWAILYEYAPEAEKSFFAKCSRNRSHLVKDFVSTKWLTILKKYQEDMPYNCPLHPGRDLFRLQEEAKKEYGPKQWHCTFCGKFFLTEFFLDNHFGLRHQDMLYMNEESICLEKYCNHFRCEVLSRKKPLHKTGNDGSKITDVDIWVEKKALNPAPQNKPGEAIQTRNKAQIANQQEIPEEIVTEKQPEETPESQTEEKAPTTDKWKHVGCILKSPKNCSRGNQQQKNGENVKKKIIREQCDKAKLEALKKECESLLNVCVGGLLEKMSAATFKQLQEELHRSTCYYLSCEHYWEDNNMAFRKFPWPLLFILITAMSFGICLCYYIIWVLFGIDSSQVHQASFDRQSAGTHEIEFDDGYYLDQASNQMHKRPTNNELMGIPDQSHVPRSNEIDQSEHYIYITYPTESKIE